MRSNVIDTVVKLYDVTNSVPVNLFILIVHFTIIVYIRYRTRYSIENKGLNIPLIYKFCFTVLLSNDKHYLNLSTYKLTHQAFYISKKYTIYVNCTLLNTSDEGIYTVFIN